MTDNDVVVVVMLLLLCCCCCWWWWWWWWWCCCCCCCCFNFYIYIMIITVVSLYSQMKCTDVLELKIIQIDHARMSSNTPLILYQMSNYSLPMMCQVLLLESLSLYFDGRVLDVVSILKALEIICLALSNWFDDSFTTWYSVCHHG